MRKASRNKMTATAAALLCGFGCITAAAVPAHAADQELQIESLGSKVVDDSSYGPSQVMQWKFTNTGTETTKYLDVQLLDGKVFLDDEGHQMLIRCTDWMFPLSPGSSATCEAWRRLSTAEIASGNTAAQDLQIVAFGSAGAKYPVTVPSVTTGGVGQVREVEITNGSSRVDLNDSTYGAVQVYTYTFKNTGNVPTKTAHLVAEDGRLFVDEEGQEMLGHCTDWMFPLNPGQSATCHFYRLLSDSELQSGVADAGQLRFRLFGEGSDLIPAPALPSVSFATQPAPAEDTVTTPAATAEVRGIHVTHSGHADHDHDHDSDAGAAVSAESHEHTHHAASAAAETGAQSKLASTGSAVNPAAGIVAALVVAAGAAVLRRARLAGF